MSPRIEQLPEAKHPWRLLVCAALLGVCFAGVILLCGGWK